MAGDNRDRLFNILTFVMLGATLCLVGSYTLVGFNVYNPFPPPTRVPLAELPPGTPTPVGPTPLPTWTPTNTPTASPTSGPTNTRAPTLTPSVTPTFPPSPTFPATVTPTPRVTRSPWPFTCEAELRRPEYDSWSGVAGHVEDLDGNPLPGYYVRTEGPIPNLPAVRAGADSRINAIYGNDAAWEQPYNPGGYQAMDIRVQLFNDHPQADGTYRAVSEEVLVQLGGYASGSLGYVTCTLNWEDW